jgi:hypothetical protein
VQLQWCAAPSGAARILVLNKKELLFKFFYNLNYAEINQLLLAEF